MIQDMINKETIHHLRTNKIFPTWEHFIPNVGTIHSQRGNKSVSTRACLRSLCLLLLMLVLGSGKTWGQTDYSGVYYIGSRDYVAANTTTNYYLCATEEWYNYQSSSPYYRVYGSETDNGQPFLTTYQCRNGVYSAEKAVWIVDKQPNGYYHIKRAIDGKYLTYNAKMASGSEGRMRLHLEDSADGDNALFLINLVSGTGAAANYDIITKNVSNNYKYLNITGASGGKTGNQPSLQATNVRSDGPGNMNVGGILGLWTSGGSSDNNSKWYLEKATVDAPAITNNFDGTFTITAASGATIYYTTDGTTPTTSTTTTGTTTVNVTQTESMTVIKAIAKGSGDYFASGVTTYNIPQCAKPVITISGGNVTITCPTEGATIHYTIDGSPAASSSAVYTAPFAKGNATTIRAIATKAGYLKSNEAAVLPPTEISSSSEITDMCGNYILANNFTLSASIGSSSAPFTGTIDGNLVTRTFDYPLVAYADGATIKNVILDDVTIASGNDNGNTGAICNEATGATRIYNCGVLATNSEVETDKDGYTRITDCSSTISGSGYVGGIVGLLDGSSRVINCFSYANITGGNLVGGIVGKNNVATTSANLKTMVMNCMFYGNITGGTSKAPIYNGEIITNRSDQSGVGNFNYFWGGASYVQDQHIDVYNCALSAETRYLQRFEFFRHLLNSNRELAAWWATDSRDNKNEMMKWVLEPSQIGTSTPYPILKAPYDNENHIIKYPSVVNIDAAHAEAFSSDAATAKTQYNQGRKFTTLTVNIQNASSGSGSAAPSGADITTESVTPNITDKDPAHFNFNYYKVQLPYYNDVGTKNYTDNKVVTGWKIVSISGGTHSFSTDSNDASATVDENGNISLTTPYNFADRKCTDKDLFSVSGRVFSQGAYFDVPEGVTSITIEPYWGRCVYVSDQYTDVVYNQTMKTASDVTTVGGGVRYSSNSITIEGSEQTVYTSMSAAVSGLNPSNTSTVYDNAVVLVGNVHSLDLSDKTDSKPYTIMSIDLDKDNEPDYSYILRFDGANGRLRVHPVRIDFLNVIGLGMAQKSTGGSGTYNFGIMQPLGWFEATNTALFRVTQFEYDKNPRLSGPMILHGGVIEQWVTVAETSNPPNPANAVTYYHVGSNVWFKEFHLGAHQDRQTVVTPHPPISVTGGDFDEFYLTGLYNTPNTNYNDNAECYINGGRFGKVAGTGMQGIGDATNHTNGNIIWQVDNADIDEFYAGGINAAHIAEGNITTVISNSRVDQFCGGPKFGDMNNETKVVTNATNCIFRTFFGAGYGGNSYNRRYPSNKYNDYNYDWNGWLTGAASYDYSYDSGYKGVETRIDYQFIPKSDNEKNVARLFIDYVSFSLATTHDVTSKLTECTITTSPLGRLNLSYGLGNFYGGGSLGKVTGDVNSTLTNCTVEGNVFGGGYSATLPKVDVMNNRFQRVPSYDVNTGAYTEGILPTTEPYTWQHRDEVNSKATAIDQTNHILYTQEDLTGLGAVTGNVTLTINGNTTLTAGKVMSVTKSVYGGGEESAVGGDTEVNVFGGTIGYADATAYGAIVGNVYGGGMGKASDKMAGLVKGNTHVNISGTASSPFIYHNVYGGGAYGSVGDFAYDANGMPTALKTANTGVCNVTITGGKIGTTGKENGMVFGSSRGDVATPVNGVDPNDLLAWVYDTKITIGSSGGDLSKPLIKGSIYGSGENGHTFNDTEVKVHSGTIGIVSGEEITYNGIKYVGPRYLFRGNVYGGGCGTDTYEATVEENGQTKKKTYYNFNAGIVKGNANVIIDGGFIVHNVYGGGAMGSVGTFNAFADAAYVAEKEADHKDAALGMPIGCAEGTGKCTVAISGGKIGVPGVQMEAGGGPDDYGHVFGAGRGDVQDPNEYPNVETCAYYDKTEVTISGSALVIGGVYGGSESGHVVHNTLVKIQGGQIGCGEGSTEAYSEEDWAAESPIILKPTNHWTYVDDGAPYDQYADENGDYANNVSSEGGNRKATDGRSFYGNVFAGGSGYYPYAQGKWLYSAGRVAGNAELRITGGHILNNVYGGCEMSDVWGDAIITMSDGTVGVPRSKQEILYNPTIGHVFGAGMGDKRIFFNQVTNVENTNVTITGGRVYGSVHGGGEDGHVLTLATTNIRGGEIGSIKDGTSSGYDGNVFGGGQGSPTALTAGSVGGNVVLNIEGGTMHGSVYGGGRIASVGTFFEAMMIPDPADPTKQIENPLYGKMQDGTDHGYITVNLKGGTIDQNVYGGCMGTRGQARVDQVRFAVSKNVTVKLNENVADNARGCAVKGSIFGCNNVNSSPQGQVEVHIYKTQNALASQIAGIVSGENAVQPKVKGRYDVKAVYGGGNMAAYLPKGPNATDDDYDGQNTTFSTKVIIDGCDRTSIQQVYGGGNAASTPATEVTVNGAFEIDELFGGGNGKDKISYNEGATMLDNPGANVGFYDYSAEEDIYNTKEKRTTDTELAPTFISKYVYGPGTATVNIYGGRLHRVFGGSNTKGNVRKTAITLLEEKMDEGGTPLCTFQVDEAYGGGKSAPMDADATMLMACIPGLRAAYGGAEAADIQGGVTLTITNGRFDRVFGGNNVSGTIRGPIKVNIEETGCKPIIIGELYGGGNLAGYSVYGYNSDGSLIESGTTPLYTDPVVNVKSFTSIGRVFGGGYGSTATMVGNPTVNINVVEGAHKTTVIGENAKTYNDENGFPIPSHASGKIGAINNVFGGGNEAKVIGNTQVNIATEEGTGADIRGNVYGGGNNAEVTGNTNVVIGKKNESE